MKLETGKNINFTGNAWDHQNNTAHGYSSKLKQQGRVPSHYSYGLLQAKNINKPLKEGVSAQTFGGSFIYKVFRPKKTELSPNMINHSFDILGKISTSQREQYTDILVDYVKELKNPKFRDKLNITDSEFSQIKVDKDNNSFEHIVGPAKKNIAHRFVSSLIDPIARPAKWLFVKVFANEKSTSKLSKMAVEIKKHDVLQSNFASVEGLVNFVSQADKNYRKKYQILPTEKTVELMIPEDLLISQIRRRYCKPVDTNKGQYSAVGLNIGNRVVSGAVAASFLSVDAFNATMALTNDKKHANAEKKSRFYQEVGRIGTTAFLTSVVMNVFREQTNRSLYNALFASGATIAVSEIVGRKLVGKAIFPSDKETLDRMEKEKNEGSGPINSLGRLMSGTKKVKLAATKTETAHSQPQPSTQTPKAVSFAGRLQKQAPQMFKTEEVISLIDVLKETSKEQAEYFENTILKGLNSLKQEEANKAANKANSQPVGVIVEKAKDFTSAISGKEVIPIGTSETLWSKISRSFLAPVNWVKGPFVRVSKFLEKRKLNSRSAKEIEQSHQAIITQKGLDNEFNEFKSKRLKLLSNSSQLGKQELTNKLMEEFIDNNTGKLDEEIKGVQNTLVWLRKQVIANAPEDKKNMPLKDIVNAITTDKKYAPQLSKIQKSLNGLAMKADGTNSTEYNSASYAVINVNMGKMITSMFLLIDAYNLTMQYSNNDKDKSVDSLKGRAVQEGSRIMTSAYILKFARTYFQKFHNAFLVGALMITGAECTAVETVSRKIVGRPVIPQSQEELLEQEKINQQSKNPVMKFLGYVLGKKGKLVPSEPLSTFQTKAQGQADTVNLSTNTYVNNLLSKNAAAFYN